MGGGSVLCEGLRKLSALEVWISGSQAKDASESPGELLFFFFADCYNTPQKLSK